MSHEHTPDQESTQATTFADKVGQKNRLSAPDPFGIALDAVAGVRLFESKQDRQMAIKFGEGRPEDKPSQAVIDKMKEAGFRWNPTDRIWALPVRGDAAVAARIDAEKLYQEVRQMIRAEKGIDQDGQEIPFEPNTHMSSPYDKYHDLHPDRDTLKNVKDERLVMTLQFIAVGSMLVLALAKASHVIKDLFRHTERHGTERHGRSK